MKVEKARLLHKIKNWNPYILWNFSIDCVERIFLACKKLGSEPETVYQDSIDFVRVLAKYVCLKETADVARLLKNKTTDNGFDEPFLKQKKILETAIEQAIYKDYVYKYLGKASKNLLFWDPTKIFAITQDLRTQAAFCFPKEYYDKYEFPVLPVVERAEDVATNVLIDRIWFAFIVKFPFFIPMISRQTQAF